MSVAQNGEIRVVPYDPRWPQLFEAERRVIEDALGEEALLVEHVGSTSVPGLVAKPKIDIVAVACDLKRTITALEGVGYTYQGEWNIPLKAAFTKREGTDVNLHVFFDIDHPEVELNIRFRDYLRGHAEVREAYANLKKELLKDPTSQEIPDEFPLYTLRKGPFIESILREMGYSRLRVLKANTDEQWEAVARFRARSCPERKLEREKHEHFVLYRGVEIVGYADLSLQSSTESRVEVFVVDDAVNHEEAVAYFEGLIAEWRAIRADSGQ